jgi:hypothetical protein
LGDDNILCRLVKQAEGMLANSVLGVYRLFGQERWNTGPRGV